MAAVVTELDGIRPTPCVVQAVMGAGKSVLIAELAAAVELEAHEVVVVTTSSQHLVRQLGATLSKRIRRGSVGVYYAQKKQVTARYIVACVDSAEKLASALEMMGRSCALWIADEAHKTECDTVHKAHEGLRPHAAVGFTATPYLASETREISLFQHMVYEYGPREGVADGAILPWKVISWTGGQVSIDEACVEFCRQGAEIGPGVVNAVSIDDAEAFQATLVAAGLRASVVHSKLGTSEVESRLGALERGDLEVIVHVSMLQEGVDLPWLRWLCLRRPISSRVRFAQEVGRVLRTFPGKTHGILYDPHDLFGEYNLSYEAVLCGMSKESTAMPPLDLEERLADGWWRTSTHPWIAGIGVGVQVRVHRHRRPTPAELTKVLAVRPDGVQLPVGIFPGLTSLVCKATTEGLSEPTAAAQGILGLPESALADRDATVLDAVTAYLRRTTIELDLAGRIQRQVASRHWREKEQTDKQWGFLARMVQNSTKRAALVPEPHRTALRHACRMAHHMNRGQASDLIEVLKCLVADREWPLREAA